tara:strand:- start:22 stop:312 length:291 start_codon:yes stop_codon:yes gene_type:complete
MDSRKRSLLESTFDIITGFILYLPINYFVLPYFTTGIDEHSIATMLSISVIYTSIALARKYTIRRWFVNMKRKHSQKNLKATHIYEWDNKKLDDVV